MCPEILLPWIIYRKFWHRIRCFNHTSCANCQLAAVTRVDGYWIFMLCMCGAIYYCARSRSACRPNIGTHGKRARSLLAKFAAKPPLGCFAGCMWTAINHERAKTSTPPQSIVEPRASHAVLWAKIVGKVVGNTQPSIEPPLKRLVFFLFLTQTKLMLIQIFL